MEQPRYPNDCEECKFLGQHGDYDLYFCPIGGIGSATVLARYGSDGDYLSGMIFADQGVLKIAKERAIEKGLLKDE